MPRQARMISATCVYHTILRGVNKLNIRYGSGVPVPCDPEAFITGSLGIYNSKDCKVCPSKILKNDKDEFVFEIAVIKDKKLVLAERQVVPET